MSESKYGGGFVIRLVILLLILGVVIVLFYQDKSFIAEAKQKIDKAMTLMDKETDDGGAIPKGDVNKEIGQDPSSTTKDGNFEIETYEFKRALPFLQKPYLTVVSQNGGLVEMIDNRPYKKDAGKG